MRSQIHSVRVGQAEIVGVLRLGNVPNVENLLEQILVRITNLESRVAAIELRLPPL